jgi:hypothetical protein
MWHTKQYSVGHQDVFLKPIKLGLSWGKIGQMGLHGKKNTGSVYAQQHHFLRPCLTVEAYKRNDTCHVAVIYYIHLKVTSVALNTRIYAVAWKCNQLPAGLLPSLPCKLHMFKKRVKNVVTGKGIQVGIECK